MATLICMQASVSAKYLILNYSRKLYTTFKKKGCNFVFI